MAKIVIFSGAGISAESGLSTFHDSNGLWEQHHINEICTAGCLDWNRENTLTFYDTLREKLNHVSPNAAHYAIAKLKEKHPNDIAIITQNIDDLFERAGCKEVLHLHGFLPSLRCEKCNHIYHIGYVAQDRNLACPICGETFRPDIVFFKEPVPMYIHLYNALQDCELLVIIGTSGNVIPIDLLAQKIKSTILNNLEPSSSINEKIYTKVLYKKTTEAIDEIVEDIEKLLQKSFFFKIEAFIKKLLKINDKRV